MSSESDEVYENPDTKAELDEKRKQLEQFEQKQAVGDAVENQTTRSKIANEEQPDPGAPDLRETYTVEYRGHEFEFYELGDAAIEAAKYATEDDDDDIEAGTDAANFVYTTLGKKGVNTSEAYWRQYDFDGIMELFFDLVEEASDVDAEDVEEIDEFREE